MIMAEAQVDSSTDSRLHLLERASFKIRKVRKAGLLIVDGDAAKEFCRSVGKRKRLNQVVDELATQVTKGQITLLNNNLLRRHYNNNNNNNDEFIKEEYEDDDSDTDENETRRSVVVNSSNHMLTGVQESPESTEEKSKSDMAPSVGHVYRFNGQERFGHYASVLTEDDVEDVFSPSSSSKSPHSSNTDSPKINLSPLEIKDEDAQSIGKSCHRRKRLDDKESKPSTYAGCSCIQCSSRSGEKQPHIYPISPICPIGSFSGVPSPVYSFEHYLHTKYLPDLFRRRSHSDSDLPLWFEANATEVGEDLSCHGGRPMSTPRQTQAKHKNKSHRVFPQESPLDLSMKTSRERARSIPCTEVLSTPLESLLNLPPLRISPSGFLPPKSSFSVPVVKGDVASPTTKESVAVRYNLEVSPVVEEMPPGSDVAYVCPVCGQMFSLHDRLAKHMASRHKSRTQNSDSTAKAYLCEVCNRSFARSDMLTRHMRLHTGVKPYTCRVCGQVFSRSDHLSTHQRTHTGEKPYKCPQCPYAACRRDMITRHMRTHTRYETNNATTTSEQSEELSSIPGSPHSTSSRLHSPANSSPMEVTSVQEHE